MEYVQVPISLQRGECGLRFADGSFTSGVGHVAWKDDPEWLDMSQRGTAHTQGQAGRRLGNRVGTQPGWGTGVGMQPAWIPHAAQ